MLMLKARGLALIAMSLICGSRQALATELSIDPVYQQTPVWCWAAVGEMVFRYYDVPTINPAGNYQCGIVALLHPACANSCGNCIVPAGSLYVMNNMLRNYPKVASDMFGSSHQISTQTRSIPLRYEDLVAELDAGRPVVAGISPGGYQAAGVSQHVALIVGYDGEEILVNDPFPFSTAFAGDPYLIAGGERVATAQYRIEYSAFRSGLRWRETIYAIRCSGSDCGGEFGSGYGADEDDESSEEPAMGRSCSTAAGVCGPFMNQSPLPLGSPCWCATPYGPASGTVVSP